MTPAERWQVGYELWRHARAVRPDGRPVADRLADLEVHERVGGMLRAVGHTTR